MDNNWITIDEASNITKKSVHTLRKTIKKPNILTKMVSGRLTIEKNSILKHYGIEEKKEINQNINQNGKELDYINQINALIKQNNEINNLYNHEKSELGKQLVAVERSKDQEILKINLEKNEMIHKKDQEILKKIRAGYIYLFLWLITLFFLAVSGFYIYFMI